MGAALALLLTCAVAQAQTPFEPLLPVAIGDEPWSPLLAPAKGPERDGKPTEALRWQAGRQPVVDSPALLAGFHQVEAIRFWMHLEQPLPFKLNVLLTGCPGGYFNQAVPLDYKGWRQVTVRVADFGRAYQPELDQATRIAFRAQGYGQPALAPGLTIWFDQFEVQPKPGARLRRTNSLESNREAWAELAAKGNPLHLLNAKRYEAAQPKFAPPTPVTSAWTYRGVAEHLLALAYAAAAPESPHRGRADLVDGALATVDWLLAEAGDPSWYHPKCGKQGDPNTNRFILGPLLDAVRYLRGLPAGEAAWPRWRDRLAKQIDHQRLAYRGGVDWDWGKTGGFYVNQDAYYVLIMALSALLYERPADQVAAAEMARKIGGQLLPDGGWHYIGQEMESPIYHSLNLVILGRYATLTGDADMKQQLKATANYWPLVCTAEGYPESWSDVWWKQNWGMPWREGMIIAAGATADARNQYLLQRVLERNAPSDAEMATVYAAPYWPGLAAGQAPAGQFPVADANIRGLRGRQGSWYYGVTQGRGLRNTFVGGLVTAPKAVSPLLAAFRGARIEVQTDAKRPAGLFLSQINDLTGLALQPGVGCAVGARYRLQPGIINGYPTPATPDTPWQVTQSWYAGPRGIVGRVVLEALADAPAVAVIGRLALGPGPIEPAGELWQCGPLRVKLLESFGTVSSDPVPHYTTPIDRAWPGLSLRQPLPQGAKKGDRFVYAAWIGPEGTPAPVDFQTLDGDAGWVASWGGRNRVAVIFSPGPETGKVPVRWDDHQPRNYTGEAGQEADTEAALGTLIVRPRAGQCVILAW